MAKVKGTGVYSKDDIFITTKVSPKIHRYLYSDAKSQFRTLPAHVASILSNYADKSLFQEVTKDTNEKDANLRNVLYTEQELKDMQKQYDEGKDNGRI